MFSAAVKSLTGKGGGVLALSRWLSDNCMAVTELEDGSLSVEVYGEHTFALRIKERCLTPLEKFTDNGSYVLLFDKAKMNFWRFTIKDHSIVEEWAHARPNAWRIYDST
jgi:hypothetical protein